MRDTESSGRLGQLDQSLRRRQRRQPHHRTAPQLLPGRTTSRGGEPERGSASPGSADARTAGILRDRAGLLPDSEHETADDRVCPGRLARRPGRVDRREIPLVVRLWWQHRESVHQRRAADQHHAVLGDAVRDVVGADLFRESARSQPASTRPSSHRLRCLPERDQYPAATLGRAAVQPDTLDRDASAVISPPWRNRSSWWRIYGHSSGRCVSSLGIAAE